MEPRLKPEMAMIPHMITPPDTLARPRWLHQGLEATPCQDLIPMGILAVQTTTLKTILEDPVEETPHNPLRILDSPHQTEEQVPLVELEEVGTGTTRMDRMSPPTAAHLMATHAETILA